MRFGGRKRRLNVLRTLSMAGDREDAEYKRAHSEVTEEPWKYNSVAQDCPFFDRRKPFRLKNTFPHVQECGRCKAKMAGQTCRDRR